MSEEFPFVGSSSGMTETAATENNLPICKEYAWDFEKNCFLYDGNGQHVLVDSAEAVKVWIYKALQTERYQYLAYSWQYGIEVKPFIGKVMSVQERYSELKRIIIECLMVNPYITSVDSVEFTTTGDKVSCEVDITTVYGEVNVNV
ncbi:DUF2634 domain-containing protein [Megasphaera paucivorans]|uniref:DUF2634 domain-containing protein n=1 Tax=Megasphaera paucivorans TaxID=349095 RepID=A0A1G9QWF7_9FIRM|nr:DUF2634 domain-containing protein [Megasphaera paucivorans]SDM15211.1 Protein of unknown function [Megasphaera paucivorans]